MKASLERRIVIMERRHHPRLPGLSSERRKFLTDKAVREGDEEALLELNLHRPRIIRASAQQRAAAIAAGLRANL